MGLYITGDKHQDYNRLFSKIELGKLNENDTIIVLGDMGLFWRHDKKDANEIIKFYEENYTCNLYFIDGNHENFKILNSLEEDENGMGYVSEHIRHLKRGRRYIIDGKSFLTIGGADSVDKFRRTEGLSWWKEEAITDEDISRVKETYYDYILTHTCPTKIFNENKIYLCTLGNIVDDDNPDFHISGNQLDKILKNKNINFGHWYFGHYHQDIHINDKFTCLYHSLEELI